MANDVTQDALLIVLAGKDLPSHRSAESFADLVHPPNKHLAEAAEAARRHEAARHSQKHPHPPPSKPASDTLVQDSKKPIDPPFHVRKMSFFGLGRPQPTSAEKIAAVEQEMKLMADMHNRMIKVCSLKCIPNDYREGELNKGESVCLDRCAAKFFEAHQVISSQLEKVQQERGGGGGGGFGTLG